MIVGGSFAGLKWNEWRADRAEVSAALNKGDAIAAKAETKLSIESGKVYASGVSKQRQLEGTHTENANKIESAPGAGAELDPAYIEQLNIGLCKYEATECTASNRVP